MVQVGGPGPPDHPAADHKIVYDYTSLQSMLNSAGFTTTLVEWWDETATFHHQPWNLDDGPIGRSTALDTRNAAWRAGTGPPGFTSLIIDAHKASRHVTGPPR